MRAQGYNAVSPLGKLLRLQEPKPGLLDLVARHVAIVGVLRSYRRHDLPHDVVAGLVLGIVTIPQAIAYAFLAGLPAQAGLYACLAPMVIYAALGSSRQLVVGPVAIAALMVAAAVGEHAAAYSDQYLAIVTVLSLQVGILLWLLRAMQLGGIVNLLSHPVISGFVNAAAILIIVSQLGAFTGIDVPTENGAVAQLAALAGSLGALDGATLALGLASVVVLILVARYGPTVVRSKSTDHPIARAGPVAVAAGATVAVVSLGLEVETVGFVPAGLPVLTVPWVDPVLWWDLAPNALLIGLVAYVESYSVGTTLAARRKERLDSHRELVALGAANIGAAFSGAYPVAGSFTRSSVNVAAGGRTPVSVLSCAVVILVTLLWLTPAFEHLPHAALAAIVIASVWGLIDFRAISTHWRFYRPDVVTHFATLAGVLLAGVEAGLVIGVSVSVVLFMRGSSRPHIAVVGRLGDSTHFRNVERYEVRTWPHIVAARVDESLYFANANQVESRLWALSGAGRSETQHLVLVMTAVNFIDTTGLEMLHRLNDRLDKAGVALHVCEAKGPVRDQLAHIAPSDWLTGDVFGTTDEAFNALT